MRWRSVLDPAVTLRWIEPAKWDCAGRDQVMRLLRERHAEGRGTAMRVKKVDEHTVVVSPDQASPDGAAATRVSIAGDKVVAMRQYATREGALATGPTG